MSFYELQAPTDWITAPSIWSHSLVEEIQACPRKWQLRSSRWGEFERFPIRPCPAAVEGQLIHDALDRLTRACGQRGNPPFGNPLFAEAAMEADFFAGFSKALLEWQERLNVHPRPGPPFRLRSTAQELANRAVRMFREQYQPGSGIPLRSKGVVDSTVPLPRLLQERGALSEVRLRHPELPFVGILDRINWGPDGAEILDFKTGQAGDGHERQLVRYALLWWRATGDLPARTLVQYLTRSKSWDVTRNGLIEAELELQWQLEYLGAACGARPAVAKTGPGCRMCPVRARCSEGWSAGEEASQQEVRGEARSGRLEGRGDIELILDGDLGDHGVLARTRKGVEVAVVYEAPVRSLLPAVGKGQCVRVVDGSWRTGGMEFELKPWTEVYVVGGAGLAG